MIERLPSPAPWSMWTGDIGRALVPFALACFLIAAVFGLFEPICRRNKSLGRGIAIALFALSVLLTWILVRPHPEQSGTTFISGLLAIIAGALVWVWSVKGPVTAMTRTFKLGAGSLIGVMAVLGTLFVNNQFQYQYVFDRGDIDTSLQYKIAGIWAGQEGSFLLWGVAAAIFGVLTLGKTQEYRRWYGVLYSLFLASLGGILAYESPFRIQLIEGALKVPPSGVGLAPSLQNYWVVIHPPTIFLGFGSLTVLACWAMSALITGNTIDWAKLVRPWAVLSVAILGVGLCMGGFWAYETLGWGGFWMWDPVENVSFVPWCFAVVLVHGLIVQGTKGTWVKRNLLFAALPFLAFTYGTFLTRSGFLASTSVHSFAKMERVAHGLLLGFFLISSAGFVGVWLWRMSKMRQQAKVVTGSRGAEVEERPSPRRAMFDRERLYGWGVFLLLGLAIATGVGMSVPMFMGLAGKAPKVVEEATYHQVVTWFFVPIMLLVAVAPFVTWRGLSAKELVARIANVLSVTIGVLGIFAFILTHPTWGVSPERSINIPIAGLFSVPLVPWMLFLIGICTFTAVASLWRMVETWKRARSSLGAFMAHFGLAILMGGLIISRGFEHKSETLYIMQGRAPVQVVLKGSQVSPALDYTVGFKGVTSSNPFDRSAKVLFDVTGKDGSFEARPGYFLTPNFSGGPPNPMVWPHLHRGLTHDVYFTLYPAVFNGEATDKISLKPGETGTLGPFTIQYLEETRTGDPGKPGTKFGAKLKVQSQHGTASAEPSMEIGQGGPIDHPVQLDDELLISMVGMDAGTKSVSLQLKFAKPVYPVELFYKPLVILVWLGTGILTLGGLLAALQRRKALRAALSARNSLPEKSSDDNESDAPVPIAQG